MQEQLFSSEGWDDCDTFSFIFYNVVLKVQIGDYPVGTKFSSANIEFEMGYVSFYLDETIPEGKKVAPKACLQNYEAAKFKLSLLVGELIPVEAPTSLTTHLVDA